MFLYLTFLFLYRLGIRVYAPFNDKAKKWIDGRRGWEQRMKTSLRPGEKRIWIHSPSVGEFEQVRPVMEEIKRRYTGCKIVVTFFSPSGFEASKNNKLIDYVFYLPMDGRNNARKFIDGVNPDLVIFSKYDFWYFYLAQLKKRGIPTLLVSGVFRQEQVFFKWYGGLFRKMLQCFSFLFVQNERSKQLLRGIGFDKNVLVSGDTRYDRVGIIAKSMAPIDAVEKFKAGRKVYIAGSTWPSDEAVIKDNLSIIPQDWKVIIAPHEVDAEHVNKVKELFGGEAVLYSELNGNNTDKRILIIDNIGMLSRLFAYGDIAYIGGGFQKGGIHNVLEPAVFGLPVIFGPVYKKFIEAAELASLRYAFPVNNTAECGVILDKLITDDAYRNSISDSLKKFMQERTGATEMVMEWIGREKWLDH